MADQTELIWLTPDKPTNISVGRTRVAEHLQKAGYRVTVRGTTRESVKKTLRERDNYEAIVGTTRAGAIAGIGVSMFHQIPLVVDHVDPISQFKKNHPRWLSLAVQMAENLAFARSAATLFIYEEDRARVERYADQTFLTALGVEFDRFSNPTQAVLDAGWEALPADLERPVTVYIGGLEPIYNLEELLAAADKFESGSLVLAGTGSLRNTVETRAANSDTVHYLGSLSHETVPGLLAACDIGISLVDDPHTLKILEYGAAGLAVVQLEGQAEQRFGDRVAYTTADPSDIAATIRRASKCDGTELQSFAKQFDWQAIAKTYDKAIDWAINDNRSASQN